MHAILEQAPDTDDPEALATEAATPGPLLFALSSTSADGLRETSRRLAGWLENRADSVALSDLAYTLARRRGYRPVRTALVAGDLPELTSALRKVADGDTPYHAAVGQDDRGPVWVFSGAGSQWSGMGADLLANEPVFAATVAQAEPLVAAESGFSVSEAIAGPQAVTGIDRAEPTLFTMQVALAATMEKSYGCAQPRSSAIRRARWRQPSSQARCHSKTGCASSAAVRRCCRGWPVPVRWRRWNCPPTKCFRS